MKSARELTCRQVVELVTTYLEDGLSPDDRQDFEQHLVSCSGCRNYLEQMRRTIETTGRVQLALPAELEEKLLEAFRGWHRA
jgi:predicted anti-sigma-YlaC factor YlaD